jgi:threonine dehydrogenase-like Zn-dependent dehydrogenase
MKRTVQRVIFPAVSQVACQTAEEELAPADDGVLIETRYSCISAGTELAKLAGRQRVEYPFIPGNRAIGRAVEIGPAAGGADVRDLVFSYTPHVSCGGSVHLAAPLPEELDRPEAALLGMAMVALAGVQTARPELGDWAAVTGAGLVGQFAAQLLLLSGARVILIDRLAGRLDAARQCGIEHAVNADEVAPAEAVAELTGGAGAGLVLECTGVPAVALGVPALCARSGQIVLVGSPRGECQTDATPLLQHVHLWRPHGNLTLRGSHEWKVPARPSDHAKHSQLGNIRILADLMVRGRLAVEPLLSAVFAPERAAEAYAALRDDPDHHLGVVFDWTP